MGSDSHLQTLSRARRLDHAADSRATHLGVCCVHLQRTVGRARHNLLCAIGRECGQLALHGQPLCLHHSGNVGREAVVGGGDDQQGQVAQGAGRLGLRGRSELRLKLSGVNLHKAGGIDPSFEGGSRLGWQLIDQREVVGEPDQPNARQPRTNAAEAQDLLVLCTALRGACPLLGVLHIEPNQAGHLRRVLRSVEMGHQAAKGVANQHIGGRDGSVLQQGMQLQHHLPRIAWHGAGLTPADAGPIIGANPRRLGYGWLHPAPHGEAIRLPTLQEHGGAALTDTGEMQAVTAHIHQLTGWRESFCIARRGHLLVGRADGPKRNQQDQQRKQCPSRPSQSAMP